MPQMSPMWWITLMMMFLTSMLLSMYLTYFNYKKMMKKKNIKKTETIKWMW